MPEDVNERVARRLRELRARAGLSLNQLADRTGLPTRTLSRIELCRQSPTVRTLARIAEGLDVDPIALFYVDELPAVRAAAPGSLEPLVAVVAGRSPADVERAIRVLRAVFEAPSPETRTR